VLPCWCLVVIRDQQIERLTWEVNQLRRELARVKAEDHMVIESLHNRVHELEMELNDLRQIAESTTTVSLCTVKLPTEARSPTQAGCPPGANL